MNRYKGRGVLTPQYKAEGGLLGAMFAPLLNAEVTITPNDPIKPDNFTDKQDPKRLYQHEADRAFTAAEDPEGVYKGQLRQGSYTKPNQTMTLGQLLGGK